jgi:hypothetical protein
MSCAVQRFHGVVDSRSGCDFNHPSTSAATCTTPASKPASEDLVVAITALTALGTPATVDETVELIEHESMATATRWAGCANRDVKDKRSADVGGAVQQMRTAAGCSDSAFPG